MNSLTPREQINKIQLLRQSWYQPTNEEKKASKRVQAHQRLDELNAKFHQVALKRIQSLSH
ncbi:MAG: hypothetical protein HRU20_20130 [Pseudomonadales bacterium]|nr:hypothetical protein [Pseudomonadales bacterium]